MIPSKAEIKRAIRQVSSSYGHGWRQMWKYFLKLLAIFIISVLISLPADLLAESGVGFAIFAILYSIFIIAPVDYGLAFASLKAIRNDKLGIIDIFEAFRNYRNAILAPLLVGVIVLFGLFLLVIPGIIFHCKLAFTPYLVVDRRMGVIEAIKESWRMTNGYAWDIFLINLVAVPIVITGLIIFLVGVIPATMWISTALASFYYAVSSPTEASV